MDVQVPQQLLPPHHTFERQGVRDHVQRVIGVVQQPPAIQSLQVSFVAGPFFRHAPGPTKLTGRVGMYANRQFAAKTIQGAVVIIREDVPFQKPQRVDQLHHGCRGGHRSVFLRSPKLSTEVQSRLLQKQILCRITVGNQHPGVVRQQTISGSHKISCQAARDPSIVKPGR